MSLTPLIRLVLHSIICNFLLIMATTSNSFLTVLASSRRSICFYYWRNAWVPPVINLWLVMADWTIGPKPSRRIFAKQTNTGYKRDGHVNSSKSVGAESSQRSRWQCVYARNDLSQMGRSGEKPKLIARCLLYKIQKIRACRGIYLVIARTFSSNFSDVSGFAII